MAAAARAERRALPIKSMTARLVERGGNWFATIEGDCTRWESAPCATEEHAQEALDELVHAVAEGELKQE